MSPPGVTKILLTGVPGCGKTTSIMKIISGLDQAMLTGFYTREIRKNNIRKGFQWVRLDGPEGILAHVDIKGPFRVGRYGVDVDGFEKQVIPMLETDQRKATIFVIDEIGKMECLSGKFIGAVLRLFDSDRMILASVAEKGTGLIQEVKHHPDTQLFSLTRENRNQITAEIVNIFSVFLE